MYIELNTVIFSMMIITEERTVLRKYLNLINELVSLIIVRKSINFRLSFLVLKHRELLCSKCIVVFQTVIYLRQE